MASPQNSETKDQRLVNHVMRVRWKVLIPVLIISTGLIWLYSGQFGIAAVAGVFLTIALEFVYSLLYGAWNVFDVGRWIVRLVRRWI